MTLNLTVCLETNAEIPRTLADTIAEQIENYLISSALYSCAGADFLRIAIDGDQTAAI
jgi:hypothetical protein